MNVALLVPVLSERDAVGTDVSEMAAALKKLGHTVRIFAQTTVGNVGATARPAALAAFAGRPEDVVIYHFSFGWAPAMSLLRSLRSRRVVRYHNITPPSFFTDYSTEYVEACRRGRDEIRELAALGCDLYLGASPFNNEDFLAAGVDPSKMAVLPPFNRVDRLVENVGDLLTLDRYRDGASTWLNVGRLAPNKSHFDLIDAFAIYRSAFDAAARLIVVGRADPRLATYTQAVHARIDQLGLTDAVHFHSNVHDSQLKSAYLIADALVSTSEHEGFCVPLAEAMALGTPVVGRAAGAVGWTAGDAGIFNEDGDPYLLAATVARVRRDADLRREMRRRGFARVSEAFSADALAKSLGDVIGRLA